MTEAAQFATPLTDEIRRQYGDAVYEGIGEFISDLFASHEKLERDRAQLVILTKAWIANSAPSSAMHQAAVAVLSLLDEA